MGWIWRWRCVLLKSRAVSFTSNIVLPRSLTVSSQLPLTLRVSVLVCCSLFILCVIFSCNRVCGYFINSCSFPFLHPVCSLIGYFPFDPVFACWQLSCFVSLQPLIIYSLFFKHPSFCPSCSSCVVLVVFAACLFVWYQFTENWLCNFSVFLLREPQSASFTLLPPVFLFFFNLWFLFVFLLSCISPEVPKEYIFYLFIFYYSVFNFYARVVGTWWFIKDSWCEVIISIWWNGKNSINEVFFLFTSECQNEILLLKNKHRLFLAVYFNRPSRQQEYTNLDPVDDWFICDRFHGFGRCRILDWCFHEMPRKWPLKVFGEKKVESQ